MSFPDFALKPKSIIEHLLPQVLRAWPSRLQDLGSSQDFQSLQVLCCHRPHTRTLAAAVDKPHISHRGPASVRPSHLLLATAEPSIHAPPDTLVHMPPE
ncbi:hypothetical protein CF326_g2030 [Tilletia indica]|nr:hypothetical protein CF326_g2030 [Tilletia indica]